MNPVAVMLVGLSDDDEVAYAVSHTIKQKANTSKRSQHRERDS